MPAGRDDRPAARRAISAVARSGAGPGLQGRPRRDAAAVSILDNFAFGLRL